MLSRYLGGYRKSKMHKFDLEERTLEFGKAIISLVNKLPKNIVNINLCSQIVRSGTSVGANYREANASLGNKDFLMKARICKKEAMETLYWLKLLKENNPNFIAELDKLIDENEQIIRIFSAIISKRSV